MVMERGPPEVSSAQRATSVGDSAVGWRRPCGSLPSADACRYSTREGRRQAMIRGADAGRRQPHAERYRGDGTGGLIRRMMRNKLALVPADPVDETPLKVLSRWAQEMDLDISRQDLLDLARSLRECIHFGEDGHLLGDGIVRSLRHQAKLIAPQRWTEKNTLRFLADRVEETLRRMGLL